jgi:hypothetical protein
MKTHARILLWAATIAAVLLPVVAEALIAANHNETLVRDQ